MQASGATDLASKGQGISDSSNVIVKGEIDDQFQSDIKFRCLCGNSLESESMIKVYLIFWIAFRLFNFIQNDINNKYLSNNSS